jgi:hypothetical protein
MPKAPQESDRQIKSNKAGGGSVMNVNNPNGGLINRQKSPLINNFYQGSTPTH